MIYDNESCQNNRSLITIFLTYNPSLFILPFFLLSSPSFSFPSPPFPPPPFLSQSLPFSSSITHRSGHAEAGTLQFDSNEVSYEQLLDVFWSIHDPTTKDRQGPDIGSQYRSMIAYHTLEQELLAKKSKANLEKSSQLGEGTIVTEIVPASTFYKAEDYHQKYYQKRGGGSCYNILSRKLKISTT